MEILICIVLFTILCYIISPLFKPNSHSETKDCVTHQWTKDHLSKSLFCKVCNKKPGEL